MSIRGIALAALLASTPQMPAGWRVGFNGEDGSHTPTHSHSGGRVVREADKNAFLQKTPNGDLLASINYNSTNLHTAQQQTYSTASAMQPV